MDIADARYVSLTTYRRNGEAVPVPVWIAPLGDGRVGFTTDAGSGKVKRMRNNPQVTLRECDMRGNVAAGTADVAGTAVIVADGPEADLARDAVRRKYGIQFTLIDLGGKLKRALSRKASPVTSILISFDT